MKTKGLQSIQINEIKKIGLEGLLTFTSFCKQKNLRYFLAFGTLLGAVRHQGFIPWDDDIDLLMPRADYERLADIYQQFQTDEWEILSYRNEPRYLFSYMKYCNRKTVLLPSRFNTGLLYGVSIDIFPLDYLAGSDRDAVTERMLQQKKEIIAKEKAAYKANIKGDQPADSIRRTVKKTLYYFNRRKADALPEYYREYDLRLQKESSREDTTYAALIVNRYDDLWDKDDFVSKKGETAELSFEGHPFTAPYHYENILRSSYGDYMVLPPKEKQTPIHTYNAFYLTRTSS